MSGPCRPSLHPLLLDRVYWRNRLQELKLAPPSVLLIPRPDLSAPAVEVEEFRIRAHDGTRLSGLRARTRLPAGRQQARIRIAEEGCDAEIDRGAVCRGAVEFVLRRPADRRLEDRVLDVLRVCELAAADEDLDPRQVRLVAPGEEREPDEFLIVARLLAEKLDRSEPAA